MRTTGVSVGTTTVGVSVGMMMIVGVLVGVSVGMTMAGVSVGGSGVFVTVSVGLGSTVTGGENSQADKASKIRNIPSRVNFRDMRTSQSYG
ncbi:MAG: hypothetical protein DRI56_06760 [Chloroflexota bacterium]|nr:MAG: hypothetical protein DRI56_06760 [Chloroflexota bacterium]